MSTVDPHAFPRETRREFVAKTLMLGAAAMLAPAASETPQGRARKKVAIPTSMGGSIVVKPLGK